MRCWTVVFLLATALAVGYALQDAGFVEKGECESNQVCVYRYRVTQEDFEDEVKMNATVTTTVEVSCDAVGEYAKRVATRFCLTFRNTEIFLSGPQDESIGSGTGSGDDGGGIPEGTADKTLAGWFCFVQTDEGKVVAVYHSHDDKPEIVNLKKSIAASFQSNFKQTEDEEEDDPQSKHVSHYSYDNKDEDTFIHRTFGSKDVVEYPSHIPLDDVDLTKDEYLTYKSGILQRSTGDVYVKVMPQRAKPDRAMFRSRRESSEPDEKETYDGSIHANKFSVSGSYSLDLEYCYIMPRATARRRRETKDNMVKGYAESTLAARDNQTAANLHRMQQLHKAIPSVEEALFVLHHNPTNSKLVNSLQNLLQLESQYGTLPGFTPALDHVLEYLQKIFESEDPDDLQMRLVIYSLLTAEGSHLSQEVLLHSLDQVQNDKERNTLIAFIAFVRDPSSAFVSQLEKRIGPDAQSTDPLLLAYGALASAASSEVQQQIVQFLRSRLDKTGENLVATVHLIHSLSNTGCNTTVQILIGYLNHADRNVQLAAINALRMHTNNKLVQTTFVTMLNEPGIAEEEIKAIIQTLIFGLEHQRLRAIKQANNALLLTALVSAAVKLNNSNLQQFLVHYILDLNTQESSSHLEYLLARITVAKSRNPDTRVRRGSDWDESNSLYNLVASYSSRHDDVSTYPYHRAYIWGKDFGISDLSCQVASGGFVGVDNDGSHFKLFGKAVAKGNAFGRSATALDAELLIEKENTEWHAKLYALVAGHVLVNYDQQVSLTWSYDWPLYDSSRYTIIDFEYPIFIYVGILRFTIGVYAQLSVDANAQVSVDVITSASAAIIPKATLTAEASATASVLELIQGGIRVSASFAYQLEPRATTRVCIPQFQVENCLDVYDKWPGNYVDIYAFYQLQNVVWCSGWFGISYPCGFEWGTEHRWDDASVRWDLAGSDNRRIWGVCDDELPECYLISPGTTTPPISPITLPPATVASPPAPVWPDGTYALPKPQSGCPATGNQFTWGEGWRYQDTEDNNNANSFSYSLHLAGQFNSNIRIDYCVKTSTSGDSGTQWPSGSYCILKRGQCPQGFGQGSVFWDDEDSANANSYIGPLPDGDYDRNTRIYYCCRSDANPSNEIVLPTGTPFFLMRMHEDGCQRVKDMTVVMEYVNWDDEDSGNINSLSSPHPYDTGGSRNHKLYFCYYY